MLPKIATELLSEIATGIKCEWQLDLINAKTGIIERHIPFHKNTILDTGMAWFINTGSSDHAGLFQPNGSSYAGFFNSIGIGSGTDTPAFTDTNLKSFIAAKAVDPASASKTISLTSNSSPVTFTMVTTFTENEGNGTIAEMGLLNGTANTGTYFCRNRLVDTNGDPTTITKDTSHLLTITARITVNRTGDPFSAVSITDSLGASNSVKSFVNNQWLADCLFSGDSASTGGLYTGSSVDLYASTTALSYTSGTSIANTDYTGLTSGVNGTGVLSKVASGKSGDNYYQDLKIEIPQSALNMNIASLATNGFAKKKSDITAVGNPGLITVFGTALAKTSTKKVYLTYRHLWARS